MRQRQSALGQPAREQPGSCPGLASCRIAVSEPQRSVPESTKSAACRLLTQSERRSIFATRTLPPLGAPGVLQHVDRRDRKELVDLRARRRRGYRGQDSACAG
jgi:hypothetical protein